MAHNQQTFGHSLSEKQAESDFKSEQIQNLSSKLDKAEQELLSVRGKMAESESLVSHMRRLMQSKSEEQTSIE